MNQKSGIPSTGVPATGPSGGRAWLLVLASALLTALAQPLAWPGEPAAEFAPRWFFSLFAYVGPIPLMIAVRKLSTRRAYWFGFIWSLLQGIVVFYWIYIPIVVFGKLAPVVGIGATVLLSALVVAPLWAAIPALVRFFQQRFRVNAIFLWPVIWTAVEYIRNYFPLGGFSWGSIGSSQTAIPVILQLGSLFGVYGLTFFVVAISAALAQMVISRLDRTALSLQPLYGVATALFMVLLFGFWRLQYLQQEIKKAPVAKVAILQGNIEQGIKNKERQNRALILGKYQKLAAQAKQEGAKILVWPEAAYPGFFQKNSITLAGRGFGEISQDVFTLAGVVFYQRVKGSKETILHNSMVVLDPEFTVMGSFHKRHLVPFGEYIPWPLNLTSLKKLVPGIGMFAPGVDTQPVVVGQANVAGLVCYEGIFPQYSRAFALAGADLLINVTNDAWYGYSSAPHQHVAFYALRAVEVGRWVVRAANAGISAYFGPDGQLTTKTRLYEDDVLHQEVTLYRGKTLYLVTGDAFAWACVAWVLFCWGLVIKRRYWLKQPH